ncbi:MAG: erg26, C-3 sterol dehydrogenase [Pycnora praestabilis]|nr:MAG: erg26, C-3 sterol dehydrogenase [Pycnora praestabilis]
MGSQAQTKKSLGNVLVIGGCGFLGHHIVSQLSQSYTAQISVLDLSTTRNRLPNVSYHDGNITDSSQISRIFSEIKPDVVIHTASPPLVGVKKEVYYQVNVVGTRVLLEEAVKVGVKAFVFTSSASVVSDTVNDLINADERWPAVVGEAQVEYYSDTKAQAEKSVLSANRKDNSKMLTTSLRPAGIFGEGDVQFVPNLMKAFKEGNTGVQVGSNDNLFDFTYVSNVAHAHILAAVALLNTYSRDTKPLDHERVDGETFLITNDEPVYFWDMARLVWSIAGDKTGTNVWVINKEWGLMLATILEWVSWAMGKEATLSRKRVRYSCMTRYYCIDKAKRVLGYQPLVGLEEAVRKTTISFLEKERESEGRGGGQKKVQ